MQLNSTASQLVEGKPTRLFPPVVHRQQGRKGARSVYRHTCFAYIRMDFGQQSRQTEGFGFRTLGSGYCTLVLHSWGFAGIHWHNWALSPHTTELIQRQLIIRLTPQ